MTEFNDWQRELADARLQDGRWVPGRRAGLPLPALLALASAAIAAATALATLLIA